MGLSFCLISRDGYRAEPRYLFISNDVEGHQVGLTSHPLAQKIGLEQMLVLES
jgi:hypothetical protein